MLKLAIFTDLDFVHFYQVPYYCYFQAAHSKKVPPESPAEPFYVSFYTTNSKNVLDQTVVKITVTETVRPDWTG